MMKAPVQDAEFKVSSSRFKAEGPEKHEAQSSLLSCPDNFEL
jgi:hypothetical protein